MDLKITVWHGESGSLFYVVDAAAPEDEQPAVLATFTTRAAAENAVAEYADAALYDMGIEDTAWAVETLARIKWAGIVRSRR